MEGKLLLYTLDDLVVLGMSGERIVRPSEADPVANGSLHYMFAGVRERFNAELLRLIVNNGYIKDKDPYFATLEQLFRNEATKAKVLGPVADGKIDIYRNDHLEDLSREEGIKKSYLDLVFVNLSRFH